jgi:hypothetical protein
MGEVTSDVMRGALFLIHQKRLQYNKTIKLQSGFKHLRPLQILIFYKIKSAYLPKSRKKPDKPILTTFQRRSAIISLAALSYLSKQTFDRSQ